MHVHPYTTEQTSQYADAHHRWPLSRSGVPDRVGSTRVRPRVGDRAGEGGALQSLDGVNDLMVKWRHFTYAEMKEPGSYFLFAGNGNVAVGDQRVPPGSVSAAILADRGSEPAGRTGPPNNHTTPHSAVRVATPRLTLLCR